MQYPHSAFKEIQETILRGITTHDTPTTVTTIAAFDLTFLGTKALCTAVVLTYPDLTLLEIKHTITDETLPYTPTLLPFREGPPILETYKALEHTPDILLIDGNGALHPERIGVASYVGVLLNKPTIGITKELTHGHLDEDKIMVHNEHRGTALKTKDFANPIYISPGHAISIATATDVIKTCVKGNKLPYPLHIAHKHLLKLKKEQRATPLPPAHATPH